MLKNEIIGNPAYPLSLLQAIKSKATEPAGVKHSRKTAASARYELTIRHSFYTRCEITNITTSNILTGTLHVQKPQLGGAYPLLRATKAATTSYKLENKNRVGRGN